MVKKKTFLKIGQRFYEVNAELPISMKIVKAKIAKRESKEYKQLRRKFNEDQYSIINFGGKWIVKEKE